MSKEIHSTAIIEEGAEIGEGCRIGPFCLIGRNVRLGRDNILHSHVVIDGHTVLGDDNEIFPFACLGKVSQDLKFDKKWVSHSRIGSGNLFREYVTVNASSKEGGTTIIGNNCLLLSYSHVAHDCALGDHVIISSDSKMAGHVQIGDHATVSAKTGIVRIGRHAFIGGFNKVTKDILPYCIADGFPSVICAVNEVGLKRRGFTDERIGIIAEAFRTMIRSTLPLTEAVSVLNEKYPDIAEVQEMIAFSAESKIGLAKRAHRR
jgi:UDP-N-acetylglucosamine acyltransferase